MQRHLISHQRQVAGDSFPSRGSLIHPKTPIKKEPPPRERFLLLYVWNYLFSQVMFQMDRRSLFLVESDKHSLMISMVNSPSTGVSSVQVKS